MAANESSNKAYYGSGQKSVINNKNPLYRTGNVNDPLQANASPVHVAGDTSTDQYYKNGGSKMQRRAAEPAKFIPVDPRADSKARPAAGAAYTTPLEGDLRRPLLVKEGHPAAIRAAVARIVELLLGGTSPVIVHVADVGFEPDIRTGLDIRVAREEISRDQYRDVQFSLAPKTGTELADQTFGAIDPASLPEVKVGEDPEDAIPDDIEAFVKGNTDADDVAPAAPEASRVQTISAPAAPAEDNDDTDDDVTNTQGSDGPQGPAGVADEAPVGNVPRPEAVKAAPEASNEEPAISTTAPAAADTDDEAETADEPAATGDAAPAAAADAPATGKKGRNRR